MGRSVANLLQKELFDEVKKVMEELATLKKKVDDDQAALAEEKKKLEE